MKLLKRIILVQWYLLEAIQIDIEGNTAIVGPNAAGKSSILDAVQAVLMGGDQNKIRLNASAGEKSKRSLFEYCLGMVRDGKATDDIDSDLQPRSSATSYIVLVFSDTDTQEETAVGLSMHAQLAGRVFEIDGRFIVPRLSLIKRDFVEQGKEGDMPISWERIKADLRRRCQAQGAELQIFTEGERFVRAMGEALGYQGRSFEPKRFAKNLQNAITFNPRLFSDVSQFVRRYILEDRPIRVKDLQDSLRRYREIEAETKKVKSKIEELKVVGSFYSEAARQLDRALQYDWVQKEAEVSRLDEEHAQLNSHLADLLQEQKNVREKINQFEELSKQDGEKIQELAIKIKSSDVEARYQELEAKKEAEQLKKTHAETSLDASRRALSGVYAILDYKDFLPVRTLLDLEQVKVLLPQEGELLTTLWPTDPNLVQKILKSVAPSLNKGYTELYTTLSQRSHDNKVLENRLHQIRKDLEKLESGKPLLSHPAQSLQDLLESRKISSKPLCDLVEITDERWRDAVESYLGGLREALIVSPENAAEAIRLYRREGRDRSGKPLYGARIVNTRKTAEWTTRIELGSLAEVVATDDPHARAYINRQLGRVIRVDTEDELLEHDRAITVDRMLSANGSVEKMRPESALMGRGGRERQKQLLETEFAEIAHIYAKEMEQLSKVLDEENHANSLPAKLLSLCQKIVDMPNFEELVSQRQQAQIETGRLQGELEQLDTRDIDAWSKTKEQLTDGIAKRNLEEVKPRKQRDEKITGEIGTTKGNLTGKSTALQTALAARTQCAQVPGFRQDAAASQFENMMAEYAENHQDVERTACNRATKNRKEREGKLNDAHSKILEYAHRHSALLPGSESLESEEMHMLLEKWAIATLNDLEETRLADLTTDAEHARNEAEQIFRSKFVGLLRDNLARIEDSLAELNGNLKKRAFHGEYYQFKKEPDPEFSSLVKWIQTVTQEDQANVGSLFDSQNDPNSEHFEASRKIQQLLLGGTEGAREVEERLADYRNYFRFDVEMRDEHGRNRTTLSQRLGKGSGGEHQAPFYVAIGAALAATYRIERDRNGKLQGGMALALFDEAFSKLDVQNTLNALAFLRDLGMQALVAAPNEKYPLLAEEMDTIVHVYRDGGYVSVEPEYLKPALRELLSSDNPYKQPLSNG